MAQASKQREEELPQPELLRKQDVLSILNIGNKSLQGLLRKGLFPQPFKIGNRLFWPREEVYAAIDRLSAQREPRRGW